jgi:hypothetical protein
MVVSLKIIQYNVKQTTASARRLARLCSEMKREKVPAAMTRAARSSDVDCVKSMTKEKTSNSAISMTDVTIRVQ